jgi:hypothetical protein
VLFALKDRASWRLLLLALFVGLGATR